jgi:GAF domain-containing protein/CheY-like chemotaxis protein
MRWLKGWLALSEETGASERIAALLRWFLVAFVLLVNQFISPYWGEASTQVTVITLALGGANLVVSVLLWVRRRPRFPPIAGLVLQLLDVAFISVLLALAPRFRESPYDILYFLVIPLVAMRFGWLASVLFAVLISGVYTVIVFAQPMPGAFSTVTVRDSMLAVRLAAFLGVGVVGGILAQLVRTQRRRRMEERQRAREREVVLRVANAISTTMELDSLMQQVFVSLQEVIPFSEGEITLWSGEEGCLISQSLFTPQGYIRREMRYAPGEGYSGWMAVNRRPLLIHDVASEKAIRPKEEVTFASHLGVPLLVGERLVGTLELSSQQVRAFTREDQDILTAASSQIAAMLDHARLYDRVRQHLEQRVQQLSVIEQIDRELSGTLDLRKIINSVLDQAVEYTGADWGSLMGMNERRDGLLIMASRGLPQDMLERYSREPWPLDQGIVGRVAQTQQPALIVDITRDADYTEAVGQTRAELAVPIRREDEILGVLNLESSQVAAFDEGDLEFIEHLAEHAAIAIHNARLFSREQRRTRELTALQEVSLELSRKLDVGDILRSVVERAVRLLEAAGGGLYTFDPQLGELELAASFNMAPEFLGTRLKLGEELAGRVAQTRQPLWVDDYRTLGGRSDRYNRAGCHAVIAVPLLYGDEVLGVLDVLHGTEGRTFGEREMRLLLPLANQAAAAIANARLFEQTRHWADQMATLQDVNRSLGTTLGVKETMQALIQGVQRLIPHSEGEVCLYDAERKVFTTEAVLGETARVASAESYSLDEGYTGWLGRHRRPLLIANCETFTEARPRREEIIQSGRLRSYLGAPMLIGDRLIGTVELVSGQVAAFDDDHLRLLTLIAGQSAVAIDNARLYELTERRLRQRIAQMVALQRIGQELNTTLLLEDNLKLIIEESIKATPSTHGNIAMYDESAGAFRVTSAQVGYTPEESRLLRQLRLGRGNSMMDDVLRSGQPEIVADARADPRPICVKREARAALSVPVLYEGRIVGVINLRSTQAQAFGEEDLQFAQTVATQISLAVGSSRRHEELVEERELVSQRATQLREILEIGNTVRADRELSDILNQIAYGVVGSVGFGVVLFSLVAEDDPTVLERISGAGIPLEDLQRLQQTRPTVQSYRDLFRDDFLLSRSYFVPQEAGLTPPEGQIFLFPGMEQQQEFAADEWHVRDIVLVPLHSSAGDLLGVMSVDNPFDRRRPTRRVVEALEIFANQAAIAVENSRLFRERERRIAELNVLNRISQATTSTLDLEAILVAIYERLAEARVLNMESFYIAIYDAERDSLRFYPVVDRGMLYDAKETPAQVGTAGWVVEHHQPLLLSSIEEAERDGIVQYVSLAGWEGERIQSYLGVPLLLGEELVGIIAAQSYQRGAYSERDKQFLLTVANQVAVAIQNARLFREREQRLAELAILNQIAGALSSALELEELLGIVHQQVGRIFDTTNFYIALYEEASDEWESVFEVEEGQRLPPERYKVGAGLTGHIIRYKAPLFFRTAAEVTDFHTREGITTIGRLALSWMGVPLIAADKVVGVMAVQSYERENAYTEQDLALFSTIASQAAIAIDNARLFNERERRITELAILNEISRALSSALELDQLLEIVQQQVSRVFDTTNFYIAAYREGSDEWTLIFQLEHGQRQPLTRHKLGAGLTGYIIRNRRPVLLCSNQELGSFHEEEGIPFIGEQAKSWLGVPLIAADEVVGVMAIQNYERENVYTVQDLALFSTIAAQAAIAIDNARLFQERERRITELAILNEVGRALSAALERDQVTQAIYEQVGRILDTTNFYVALYDEECREWELVLDLLDGQPQPPSRHSVEAGLTGYIIRDRQPLLFCTAAELEDFHQAHGIQRIGLQSKSWLGVPMIAADRVVGVIGVESYEQEYLFSEDDLAVLSTVAAQAAVALDNARLFEETRQRLQQVNTLLEVSRDVAMRLDLPVLLQSILQSAVQSVPAAERGSVLLLDAETQELAIAALIGYPEAARRDVRFGLDEGFAAWVCREGRADIVADARTDPRFVQTESSQGILSIMSAPLIGRRGLVGVINLNSLTRIGAFGQQDLEFLSGLAHQAAVAIENARLFEERERQAKVLESRVRELSALLEGTRAITSTLEAQQMLDTLVGVVGRQMEVDTVSLWLVKGEEIVSAAAIGLPERFLKEVRVRVGEGLSGHIAATGKVFAIPDVTRLDQDRRNPAGAAFDEELGLHAYLGVPITYQQRVLGVLSVMARAVREFSPEEQALLTGLAEQAGIAVENARLFQERERRIAELTALNEVGRAISSTMRLDELLGSIRQEAARLVDTSNFLVALYDERSDSVSFPVYHEYGQQLEMESRQASNGLTEYVMRQRAPVLINGDSDAFCEAHGVDHHGTPSQSWLGVPLIYMDRVVGIIALQDYEHADAYDEHHVRLLSTIASQAAVAIQNARLFSDLEASRTELETRLIQLGALQETGQVISGTLEVDAVIDTVLEAVTATIGFSYAMLSLVDEEAQEVRAVRGIGVEAQQIASARRPLDSPDIMADIVRTGNTEIIDGWDDRFDQEMYEEYGHANLVRVFAPLVARSKVIGLIEAGYPKEIRASITRDDIEVLQTFLTQASIAIDNARLFAEIRRFTEELEGMVEARTRQLQDEKSRLEALHTITSELSRTLDLDEILLKTMDMASTATGRSMGMVMLIDLSTGNLVCRAMLGEGYALRPGRQTIRLNEAWALRRVLDKQEPLRIEDVIGAPEAQGLPALPAGVHSVAVVPLVSAEEVVGAILLSHPQVGFFDDDQMRLVTTLAGEVATAIHNAELYGYINDQALRLAEMLTYQQEEASKVRAILQSVADGVIVVDREDHIILSNPAAQQILGMAREDLEGRTTQELPGLFMAGGIFAQEHLRFELVDHYVNVHSASVITDTGETLGTVFVLRDITREVEADRSKSEFISTVSHELRTPLTSIKGYVDLILLGSVGDVSPMQRSFLEVVRSNSNRLVDLINDILDISRVETGRIVLNREPLSIFDLVEEVVESARTEIERKQLRLEVEVPPDLPAVSADRKRIVQVLANLVSNAYKYTREGGRLAIAASSTDGFLQVSVTDSGVGISKEDQKKLFTRFFRADNPMRDEVGGTGLGLAISKSFIELHGGEMWVESELNAGSTFSFTLPLLEGAGQPVPARPDEVQLAAAGQPPRGASHHILVVDDEPHIGDLLRYQLEHAGYRVSVAHRGERALDIARREHPDLITLDILMAGMGGFEVLERLKADERTADIPVVIISIVAERENLMAMGAVDFLPKPLQEVELLATIRRVLGVGRAMARVLVADDDPDIVGWLRRVLEEQGCEVQEAGDGEAVLESVLASPPDVILLDLRMPKLDGREVITRLKLRDDTRDIPIIVITASSVDKERDRVQILGLGAESFLTKPFTAAELVSEMEQVLRKRMEATAE